MKIAKRRIECGLPRVLRCRRCSTTARVFRPMDPTFSSSREALVTAKSRIVKKGGSNAGRDYGLLREPARVVFLGKGGLKNGKGDTVLEAPFLILSMEDMTEMAKGACIVVRDGPNKLVSGNDGSWVVVDLATGGILRSGRGW